MILYLLVRYKAVRAVWDAEGTATRGDGATFLMPPKRKTGRGRGEKHLTSTQRKRAQTESCARHFLFLRVGRILSAVRTNSRECPSRSVRREQP